MARDIMKLNIPNIGLRKVGSLTGLDSFSTNMGSPGTAGVSNERFFGPPRAQGGNIRGPNGPAGRHMPHTGRVPVPPTQTTSGVQSRGSSSKI